MQWIKFVQKWIDKSDVNNQVEIFDLKRNIDQSVSKVHFEILSEKTSNDVVTRLERNSIILTKEIKKPKPI